MKQKKEALFLRVSPDLSSQLKNMAELSKISLNEYCTSILENSSRANLVIEDGQFLKVIKNAKKIFLNNLEAVIIFGSWARGDNTTESDLDILIVLDNKIKISRELYSIWDEKAKLLDDKISIHFSQLPDSSLSGFWCEIACDGIVIFDKDFKTSKTLITLREEILSGKYTAKFSHGHRYWLEKEAA